MKNYTAKTIEEAVELAAQELGIPADEVVFTVVEEKKNASHFRIQHSALLF